MPKCGIRKDKTGQRAVSIKAMQEKDDKDQSLQHGCCHMFYHDLEKWACQIAQKYHVNQPEVRGIPISS